MASLNFSFKETDMDKVIENVKDRKSHIGIIFLSDMTEKFMNRVLNASEIEFNEIKRIKPHVFLNINHPLAEEEEISLIVLGATGLSYIERIFIGSVADYIIKNAPCDVLVVRQ